jgi:hypothetical protein
MSKLPQKNNKKEEAELRGKKANEVVVDEVQAKPVLEVNYPTEPTFEEREAVAWPMMLDSFNEGLVKQVEEGKSIIEILDNKDDFDEEVIKLELKNTSSYAANIQNVNIPDDFIRMPLDELGKVGPYNRYANFPVEVTEPIVLQNPNPDEVRKLPPVNSLVAPKTVKAIEQAPVVNNGGTIAPQVPQAQPVGRQRHTFKARPDKEVRNV